MSVPIISPHSLAVLREAGFTVEKPAPEAIKPRSAPTGDTRDRCLKVGFLWASKGYPRGELKKLCAEAGVNSTSVSAYMSRARARAALKAKADRPPRRVGPAH